VKRSICIWLGFAVIFVLTMFPPWIGTRYYEGGARREWRLWHARQDIDPVKENGAFSVDVDYRRMLTEIGVGESFVLALYLTWGRTLPKRISSPPRPPESKEQIQEDVDG
jgi:hypothetical protein